MIPNRSSFSFISALLLLLVFAAKITVESCPVVIKVQKVKSINNTTEKDDSNDDESEKKSESKEFLVEDASIGTFISATANKFRFHNDELIGIPKKVVTLPPKKV